MEELTPAEERIRELFEALDSGHPDQLLDGIHPAARLRPITANGATLVGQEGAGGWLADLERRDTRLRHLVERTIPVGDDRVVVVGRQQRFEPGAGLSDRTVIYLLQLRGGLLWRGEACASVEDALALAGEDAS